jgi:hypothetical protein
MAIDDFPERLSSLNSGPATRCDAITKSDTVDLARVTRGIYVGGAGDIAVIASSGTTATFSAVPVGTILPIRVSRVMSTGTTATLLIGLS